MNAPIAEEDVMSAAGGPLSDRELRWLARLEQRGQRIGGLGIGRDPRGRAFVRSFDPLAMDRGGTGMVDMDHLNAEALESFQQGRYDEAAAVLSLQVRMLVRAMGVDHQATWVLAGNLANALRQAGDLQGARSLQERAHPALVRLSGATAAETLTAANNLAVTLIEQGEFARARALQEAAVNAMARLKGADDPSTLLARGNLAFTMHQQGDLAAAMEIQEFVYAAMGRRLGPDHPETLRAGYNLADTALNLGHAARACGLFESVLEARQRVLPRDHPDTLMSMGGLAGSLMQLGDLRRARETFERCHEAMLRSLGAGHRLTLLFGNGLVETLRLMGEFTAAHRLAATLHEAGSSTLGADHPEVLLLQGNLANTLRALGDLHGARQIQAQILAIHERNLAPHHPHRLTSAGNLASTLTALGDFAGARAIEEQNLLARTKALGALHPATLASLHNLGDNLRHQGDHAAARAVLAEAYRGYRQSQGERHPNSLQAANSLAATLRSLGENAAARPLLEETLAAQREVLGEEHPNALTTANNLAQLLLDLQDHAAAGALYVEVLRAACGSGAASEIAFMVAANVPMLIDPEQAWPQSVIRDTNELLPGFSRLLRQHLERLPQESWDEPFALFASMHWHWLGWAMKHAPAQILDALGGLHGVRSWSQVRADLAEIETAATRGEGVRRDAAAGYLGARETLNRLREQIANRMQRDPTSKDLPALRTQERTLALQRERAELRLNEVAPDLAAGVGALAWPAPHEMSARLRPGNALLFLLPAGFRRAYLVRPDSVPECLELGDVSALRLSCDAFVGATQSPRGSGLRGGMEDGPRAVLEPAETQGLAALADEVRTTFWLPLLPHLADIDRLHLVTGLDLHGLWLEFALPPSHTPLYVQRYCGLPAFQRSILPDMLPDPPPVGQGTLLVLSDDSLDADVPIPFTRLDALLPQLGGLAQRIGGQALLERLDDPGLAGQPLRLMLSTHGTKAGDGGGAGGVMLLPGGLELDPPRLSTNRRRVELLLSMSCWGGRVGFAGHGDAYGSMSTLQLAGLRAGLGCLAPVPDFYTPLFSAFLWHELIRQPGLDLAAARVAAVTRLCRGPWDGLGGHLSTLRNSYRALMLELLAAAQPVPRNPEHNGRAGLLLVGLLGWSLPGRHRRYLDRGAELQTLCLAAAGSDEHTRAHESLVKVLWDGAASPDRFVDDCLDVLLREPGQRDPTDADEDGAVVEAIERLCAMTVCFGGHSSWTEPEGASAGRSAGQQPLSR